MNCAVSVVRRCVATLRATDATTVVGMSLHFSNSSVREIWYARDVGFRAHTSGYFCVDKSSAKSTSKGLSSIRVHKVVADLFHVSGVIGRRHRITMAPSSALLTQKIPSNTIRSSDQ